MPRRPRQHELETESRAALDTALPSRFVTRPITPDYGLDVEIEEFGEDGAATGLRFYAQLKATDDANLTRALRLRVSLDKENYYRSLPVPVLMVRYHAPTSRLYARWFHAYDPYYDGERTVRSLPFKWQESDDWAADTAARLVAEARAFLRFRQPTLPLPLQLFLERDDEGRHGLSDTEALFALQRMARSSPGLVDVARGPAPPGEAAIRLMRDAVIFDARGVGSATFHLPDDYVPGDDGDLLAVDVLTTVALGLAQLHQPDVSSRFAAAYAESSTLLEHPTILWALSSAMAASRRVLEGLSLAHRLDARDDARGSFAALLFTLPALFHSHALMPIEAEELERVLRQRAELIEEAQQEVLAGAARYSLGNYYRTHGAPRLAVREYRRALRLDPSYESRGYIWAEIGGALFGAEQFAASAGAYQRARELSPDITHYGALHGDALMFSGAYLDARDAFAGALEHADTPPEGEWILKHWFTGLLVDGFGMSAQRRDTARAAELVEHAIATEIPENAAALLSGALQSDALSGLAWFNQGSVARNLGQDDLQWLSYLAAAILQPTDVESWVNAFMLGLTSDVDPTLTFATIAASHRAGGEDTKRQLIRFLRKQPPEVDGEAVLRIYEHVATTLPRDEESRLTLRLFGDDESEVLELARRAGTA
jgi:tetratricopeptide (TPR) repeat protein